MRTGTEPRQYNLWLENSSIYGEVQETTWIRGIRVGEQDGRKRGGIKRKKSKNITEIIFEFLFVSLFSFYCAFARIETNYIYVI